MSSISAHYTPTSIVNRPAVGCKYVTRMLIFYDARVLKSTRPRPPKFANLVAWAGAFLR
jgi:hypothetical protein